MEENLTVVDVLESLEDLMAKGVDVVEVNPYVLTLWHEGAYGYDHVPRISRLCSRRIPYFMGSFEET